MLGLELTYVSRGGHGRGNYACKDEILAIWVTEDVIMFLCDAMN